MPKKLAPIFFSIPFPIWKVIFRIFEFERKTLENIRLVCKIFRNLVSSFWRQVIPIQNLAHYLNQIQKFKFEIGLIQIRDLEKKDILTIDLQDRTQQNGINSDAIFIACKYGYVKIVEFLLKNGADVNETNQVGWTPLFVACQNGDLKMVKLLLDNGADVKKHDNKGHNALKIANQNGYEKILKLLQKQMKE